MSNLPQDIAGDITSTFTVATDILYRQLGNEAVLLHIPSGNYFSLNPTAMLLWEAICAGAPRSGIEKVAKEYDVEPEQVNQDYLELVNALCDHDLLLR
jgi:Coenzyme PQQ synthesis protein D (PqqD)